VSPADAYLGAYAASLARSREPRSRDVRPRDEAAMYARAVAAGFRAYHRAKIADWLARGGDSWETGLLR